MCVCVWFHWRALLLCSHFFLPVYYCADKEPEKGEELSTQTVLIEQGFRFVLNFGVK